MKYLLTLIAVVALGTHSTSVLAGDEEAGGNKAATMVDAATTPDVAAVTANAKTETRNLQDLLDSLKIKGANAKPVKHEVAVPVASAGVRGEEVKAGDRFAVVWPDEKISPLTALAMNLSNAAAQGKDKATMKKLITDFQENFPEHKDDPLLQELTTLLTSED